MALSQNCSLAPPPADRPLLRIPLTLSGMTCHVLSGERVSGEISPISEKQSPPTALPVGEPSLKRSLEIAAEGETGLQAWLCSQLISSDYTSVFSSIKWWRWKALHSLTGALIHSFNTLWAVCPLISSPLGIHHPICSHRSELPIQCQCVVVMGECWGCCESP